MASSRCAEDAILPNHQLSHAICNTNLCNQLNDFWVVVAAITADDEESSLRALGNGQENAGDEGLAVVGLLEDGNLFTKARPGRQFRTARGIGA